MRQEFILRVNDQTHRVDVEGDTPLLYFLRNDLGLKGVKLGCGSEQCGACKVLIDGQAVPTCKLPIKNVAGMSIVTVEGLGTAHNLHPLQEAFIEEQAVQCGYCTAGMIVAAQGLLNQHRYPTDAEIGKGLEGNLCRCGVYERIRRAIKLRIGRPDGTPLYEMHNDQRTLPGPEARSLPNALVETLLLNRPGFPFLGSEEAAKGPTHAAIANPIYIAVGVRLREIPFISKPVKAVLNGN